MGKMNREANPALSGPCKQLSLVTQQGSQVLITYCVINARKSLDKPMIDSCGLQAFAADAFFHFLHIDLQDLH